MSSTRRLLLCSGQGTAPAKPVCSASRRGDTGRSQASHLRVQAEAGPSPAVRHWRGRAQPRHPGATSRPETRANTPSPRAGSLRLHRAEGSGPATSGTERPGASPGPPRELAQCSDPEKEELTSPTPPSWTVACWTLRSAPGCVCSCRSQAGRSPRERSWDVYREGPQRVVRFPCYGRSRRWPPGWEAWGWPRPDQLASGAACRVRPSQAPAGWSRLALPGSPSEVGVPRHKRPLSGEERPLPSPEGSIRDP